MICMVITQLVVMPMAICWNQSKMSVVQNMQTASQEVMKTIPCTAEAVMTHCEGTPDQTSYSEVREMTYTSIAWETGKTLLKILRAAIQFCLKTTLTPLV